MKKRIVYILTKVYWEGQISRKDLQDEFNISAAQASKNFAEIKNNYKDCIKYDSIVKRYIPDVNIEQYLEDKSFEAYLSQRNNSDNSICHVSLSKPYIPVELFRAINICIEKKYVLKFIYSSLSSKEKTLRIVYPHKLVDSGYRWHIRAWERDKNIFKDFNLSRIDLNSVGVLKENNINFNQQFDDNWNEKIDIFLVPNISQPEDKRETIALDFNMIDSVLHIKCRKALLIYTLNAHLVTDFRKVPNNNQLLSIKNYDDIAPYLPKKNE